MELNREIVTFVHREAERLMALAQIHAELAGVMDPKVATDIEYETTKEACVIKVTVEKFVAKAEDELNEERWGVCLQASVGWRGGAPQVAKMPPLRMS